MARRFRLAWLHIPMPHFNLFLLHVPIAERASRQVLTSNNTGPGKPLTLDRLREVLARLHFAQAAGGAVELEKQCAHLGVGSDAVLYQ